MIYELYPDHYNHTHGLYYAPSIEYFGREHLPYAILALVVLCMFVLLPVAVLALYPFSIFQRFLNLFPIRWYVLHTFVDSFYGCYKDGTRGTRDYRWCAAIFFIIRIGQFLLYFIPSKLIYNVIVTLCLVLSISLISILQPFKTSVPYSNAINMGVLQLLTLLSITIIGISVAVMISPDTLYFFYVLGVIFSLVPILYFIAGFLFWIHTHKRYSINILHRLRAMRHGYDSLPDEQESLPDRIKNSGEYHRGNLSNFT
jgi:hypothetical protein